MKNPRFVKSASLFQALFTGAVLLVLSTGCKNDKHNIISNPSGMLDLIVENGRYPVWMPDGIHFLHTMDDSTGIYLTSKEDGSSETVWEGLHNHDYKPSHDGAMVAFSVPSGEAGLYVVNLFENTTALKLAGSNPSWLSSGHVLIAESTDERMIRYDVDTDSISYLEDSGRFPHCSPRGNRVAYLHASEVSGFNLRVIDLDEQFDSHNLANYVGSDLAWDSTGTVIFPTIFSGTIPGTIVKVDASTSAPNPVTVLENAMYPSVCSDGNILAVTLANDHATGVVKYDISSGQTTRLAEDGNFPTAHRSKKEALLERTDGIYHLVWY